MATERALENRLVRQAQELEPVLAEVLHESGAVPPLRDAMYSAVLGGGKRFRPFLVASCCALFDIPLYTVQRIGAAVEFLHAASLVLDDLPAMDNAEMRRGDKAVHMRFGEAQAILSATALIALSFQVLSDPRTWPDGEVRAMLAAQCARAIGAAGITGGQALDLADSTGTPHKTANLTTFCCEVGAILGQSPPPVRDLLCDFGATLGHAFQERDDLLDDDPCGISAAKAGFGHRAKELAMLLNSGFGFPEAKVASLVELADWSMTRLA